MKNFLLKFFLNVIVHKILRLYVCHSKNTVRFYLGEPLSFHQHYI
jgi:hypothetical protein